MLKPPMQNVVDRFFRSFQSSSSNFLVGFLVIYFAIFGAIAIDGSNLVRPSSFAAGDRRTNAKMTQPPIKPRLELSIDGRPIQDGGFSTDYPERINGSLIFDNRSPKRVEFVKNLQLLSSDYKEVYYENSQRIVTTDGRNSQTKTKDFCFYHGTVGNGEDQSSTYATLNLCNRSISGTVFVDHKYYIIDNGQLSPSDQYFPSDHGGLESSNINRAIHRRKRATQIRPDYYRKYVTWNELYVELAIVFDNSMYEKYGKDKKRLSERAIELANFINAFYQPLRIKVALTGVEIWSGSDRIVVNTSGDTTLDQFLRYRRVNLIHDIPNDHAQLMTNVTFNGGVVGKAMKGTMCSADLSGAVVMDHDRFKIAAPIAATMAHEMGHNFGMEHDNDTCECPHHRCLMAASSSGAGNIYWSSCSLEYLSLSVSHGADYCLRNKPPVSKDRICGNGFVEDGEECDCGTSEVCDNPCCNAATCRFVDGAVCANGGCCDLSSCQFKPLATTCRETENECDLPEFCNGKSESCPKDTYKQNGSPCLGDKAFCHNGTCGNHDSQCKLVWGPTGQTAPRECYQSNMQGKIEGNCGLDGPSYVRCEPEDTMCGLLQCAHKTERTSYGDRSVVRMTSVVLQANDRLVNCHTATIDLGIERPNPGFVPNGAKCGDGKMCQSQKCISVVDVRSHNSCPANCHASGVCNNLGHCHCISGYGGIDCSIPGLGGSIDSGPSSTGAGRFNVGVGILIFLLVVLPLITVVVTFLYKKGLIKAPRFKLIDLLFKPRRNRAKNRSDVGQNGARPARAFQPTSGGSVGRKTQFQSAAPPPDDPNPVPLDWKMPKPSIPVASSSPIVRYDDVRASIVLIPNDFSDAILDPPPPPRPARPSDDVLEKLYYTDVSSTPRVDYAGFKREAPAPIVEMDPSASSKDDESLLSEVMTALEPDYGPVILPQRRAPLPPAIVEEETGGGEDGDGREKRASIVDGDSKMVKSVSVKDKKRFFESSLLSEKSKNSPSTLKRAVEISDPLDPKIGGERVDQAASLLIVSHLESQTLPRKKKPIDSLSTQRPSRIDQRRSTAAVELDGERSAAAAAAASSNLVQRSQSSVTGNRPLMAPPPPPVAAKPAISPKPSFLTGGVGGGAKSLRAISTKPVIPTDLKSAKSIPTTARRHDQKAASSSIPLVDNENFDSDEGEAASINSKLEDQSIKRSDSENYYDVIASPVREKLFVDDEDIYADIDEFSTNKPTVHRGNSQSKKSIIETPPNYGILNTTDGKTLNE